MECAASVIRELSHMFSIYDRLIIIENDALCSQYILFFLNFYLNKYEEHRTIFNIFLWSPLQHFYLFLLSILITRVTPLAGHACPLSPTAQAV